MGDASGGGAGGKQTASFRRTSPGEMRRDLITVSPFTAKLPGAKRLFNLAEKGGSTPSIWKPKTEKIQLKIRQCSEQSKL